MAGRDIATGALSGAGTGAAIGSFGGPWGAGIGAGIGALGGGIAGWFAGRDRDEANEQSQSAILEARKRLQELATGQRAQREQDLQQALSYFDPVKAEMTRLYGRKLPQPVGQPGMAAPAPVRPGMNSLNTLMAPGGGAGLKRLG
jgi:hypothetical protein